MDNSTFTRCEELFGTEIWANLPERDQLAVGEFLLDREIGAFEHPFMAARSFFIGDVSPTALQNTRDLLSAGIISGENPAANLGRHFAASEDPFVRDVADFLGKSDNIRFEFGRFGEAAAFGGHTLSSGQHTVFVNLDAESPDGFLDTLLHETVHCMQRGNIEAGITTLRTYEEPDTNSEAVARLRAFLVETRVRIESDSDLLAKIRSDPRLNNAFFARADELDQVVEFADDLVTNPRVSALLVEIDVRAEKKSFLSRAWQFVSGLVLGKSVEPAAALARRDAILLATPHDYSDLTGIAESSALSDGRAAALQIAENFPARHLVGKYQSLFAGVSNEAQYVTRRDQVLSGLREDISGGRFLNRAVNLRPYEAQAGRKISDDEAARMLAEMHTKQKAIQTGWHDYLATGGYTPEVQFLILNTIAREVAMPKQAKEQGITFRECKDCKPDPACDEILSAADYEEVVAELLSQAKSTPMMEEFGGIPDRVKTIVSRIVRDTAIARRVKELHGHRCQVCGERVSLGGGVFYSEAHHIRPLGKPHDGPDSPSNLLCVCPNHHVELDYRAAAIKLVALRTVSDHRIDKAHVGYHNDLVKKQSR